MLNLLHLIFPPTNYRDYLHSFAWKHKREKALRRAGRRCQVCNSPSRLELHHRDYSNLFHERNEDLIVLCHTCHAMFHRGGRMPARTTARRNTRTRTR